MSLAMLFWLQAQPLSKTVIAVAALLFVLAIVLVVYFVRKLRANSKTDDDWSLTRSSLFVEPSPAQTPADATTDAGANDAGTTDAPEPVETEPGETRLLASDAVEAEPRLNVAPPVAPPAASQEPTRTAEMIALPKSELKPDDTPPATELLSAPQAEPPARDERRTQVFSSPPPPREERKTEVLSSYQPEPLAAPAEIVTNAPVTNDVTSDVISAATTDDATPFDEGVWAGLDAVEPPAAPDATRELRSPAGTVAPRADIDEPLRSARVEQEPPRAPFTSPVVEPPGQSRAPFEPPTINPITPREQTALLGSRKESAPARRNLDSPDEPSRPSVERPAATERDGHHEPHRLTVPLYSDRSTPEASEPIGDRAWDEAELAQASRARSTSQPAGNVLGLPMEMSRAPLVLGTPVKSREEIGIGSLTGYGRVDKEGGRGGLIVLAIALLLFGGAALAYFFVPSVHERVNTWTARARGLEPTDPLLAKPMAMIFPSRTPETDKNTVHAKGAVQNISSVSLENLSLEVQLNKSNGETEMLNIPVTPAQLAPNDQGAYAFDYEAKGVLSYTIKRLFINGKESRFTAPGQK
ncbi:MAG: hypothetical protein ACJ74J_17105 [Blastocatellia bacterium]